MRFQALESQSEIRDAIKLWQRKFSIGAEQITKASWWNTRIATSGTFKVADAAHQRNWIAFGRTRNQNSKIVEINPPVRGIPRGVQGLIAKTDSGSWWILHNGRLHPKQKRITEEFFDKVYPGERVEVHFSDAVTRRYHPVANIDQPAGKLQDALATFVGQCNRVRVYHTDGVEEAKLEKRVEDAEGSYPESTTPYILSRQVQKVIDRKHGKLWNELVAFLDENNIPHTNSRVGRWGPDLRTKISPRTLFEVKTSTQASDIQRGLGQLILYEKLLKRPHKKVLLLPKRPSPQISKYLGELNIRIVIFKSSNRGITFPADTIV